MTSVMTISISISIIMCIITIVRTETSVCYYYYYAYYHYSYCVYIATRTDEEALAELRSLKELISTEATFGRGDLSVCPLGGFIAAF